MSKILDFPTSDRKLKALILYVLNRFGPMTHEQLGMALWKIDSQAFVKTGKSITGSKYYRES